MKKDTNLKQVALVMKMEKQTVENIIEISKERIKNSIRCYK